MASLRGFYHCFFRRTYQRCRGILVFDSFCIQTFLLSSALVHMSHLLPTLSHSFYNNISIITKWKLMKRTLGKIICSLGKIWVITLQNIVNQKLYMFEITHQWVMTEVVHTIGGYLHLTSQICWIKLSPN